MADPWRWPPAESVDLYPGLTVCDNRVTGSITAGQTRLPLWAFTGMLPHYSWEQIEDSYSPGDYGWTADEMGAFLSDLLEMRGEFGRLLLVLADAERCEGRRGRDRAWWETKKHRKRVGDQLRRCLAALEDK